MDPHVDNYGDEYVSPDDPNYSTVGMGSFRNKPKFGDQEQIITVDYCILNFCFYFPLCGINLWSINTPVEY